MAQKYTRQETIAITQLKSGKLSYYDELKLVVPEKHGNPKRPRVLYSAEQVLQLKLFRVLRDRFSLEEIRQLIELLKNKNYDQRLFDCNVVVIEDEIHLISDWEVFGKLILSKAMENNNRVCVRNIGTIGKI